MGQVVHLRSAKLRLTAVLKAYLDESYGERVFSIGGYFGPEGDWARFESEWSTTLSRFGITSYHATDWENRQAQFKDWQNEKRIELEQELINIIHSVDIWGILSAISLRDYKEIFQRQEIDGPYFLCFQNCVGHIAEIAGKQKEQVALIFDRNADIEYRAIRLFNHIKERNDWLDKQWLGTIAFSSKEKYVPLQAADLLAYEGFKELDNQLQEPIRRMRKPLELLSSKGRLVGIFWDRARLEQLKMDFLEADAKGLNLRVPIKPGDAR